LSDESPDSGAPKKKMGRPKILLSPKEFRKLCSLQCTLAEIADFFDVSEDTVERRCQEWFMSTFADAFKKYSAGGRQSLRRAQFKFAYKGNTALLIFLGKQYLGQRDVPELGNDDQELPQPVYGVVESPTDKTSA
jgi:hypothetical protein